MPKVSIFPRGFEIIEPGADANDTRTVVVRTDEDAEITQLYHQYVHKNPGYNTWEFRMKVIRAAKRLIGKSLAVWLARHSKSGYILTNARKFIDDTLRYLDTGVRTVSPINWLELLDDKPTAEAGKIHGPDLHMLRGDNSISPNSHYVTLWLRQPNGFEDLLISLYVMYGPSSPSVDRLRTNIVQSPKNPKIQRFARALGRP